MTLLEDRGSFTSEVILGPMPRCEEVTIILYSLVDTFIAARKVYRRMYLSILSVKSN